MNNLSIDDEDEWAKQQGVPSFEEPFIQKYLNGRDALIAQEKRQRSGEFVLLFSLLSIVFGDIQAIDVP